MRSRHPITSLCVIVAASVLAAGCGSGSPATSPTTHSRMAALVTYAHCMRSHGVASFPDPTHSEGIPKEKIPLSSPQLNAAFSACQYLMPAGGLGPRASAQSTRTRVADALAFARCMRARGFPGFPDPTAQGELTPDMVTKAGIDLHQPNLLRAGLACVPVTHGLLTRAAIARAVRGG